jgi:uncharacterized protein YjbJ (UPF0337 family)
MTTDKIKGKAKDMAGTGKEKLGRATGDEEMEAEGTVQKGEGKAQGALGTVKDKAKEIKEKVL